MVRKVKKTYKVVIPKNTSEEELVRIIDTVTNKLAGRFKFGYHTFEDIKQQASLFALEGLKNYDGVRPLENFLWTHVHNRLFNFKRDKFERPGKPCWNCLNCVYNDISEHDCIKFNDKVECEKYHAWVAKTERKKSLMNSANINSIKDEENAQAYSVVDFEGNFDDKEILSLIERELPTNMRHLFLRLKLNAKLSSTQRSKIMGILREILTKYGYLGGAENG